MKEKPIICPKCKGRLFFEGRNGEKTCTKCGFVIYGGSTASSSHPSASAPKQPAKTAACPTCGSLAELSSVDAGGREIYSCSFCGSRFTPMPKAPKPEPVRETQEYNAPQAPKPAKQAEKGKALNGRQIFEHAVKNTVEVHSVGYGSGTGFYFADGYILTNAHVVINDRTATPVTNINVNLKGKENVKAVLICYDIAEDIAVLSTTMKCEEIVRFSKKDPETGEPIYAVGNTNGQGMCILEGVVADSRRKVGSREYTMISANIFHGNSGGPVFNTKGECVGIACGGEDEKLVAMNYSIPVDRIMNFLKEAERQSKIRFNLAK